MPEIECLECGRRFPIMSRAEGRRIMMQPHKTEGDPGTWCEDTEGWRHYG